MLSEEDKVTCFIQGLRQRTRTEIELRQITSWSEAYRIAATIEAVRDDTTVNHTIKHNTMEFKKKIANMVCHKCKKPGHIAKNCNSKPLVAGKLGAANHKNMKCYRCGLLGHIATSCKVKLPNPAKHVKSNNLDVSEEVKVSVVDIIEINNLEAVKIFAVKGVVNNIELNLLLL